MGDDPPRRSGNHRSSSLTRAKTAGGIASVIQIIGALAAVVLVVHVLLTVGGANPDNGITEFVAAWADRFALGFRDLFTDIDGANTRVLVNYGIAAVFWLVVSAILARLVRRLGGSAI